jgi:hypothetical protein
MISTRTLLSVLASLALAGCGTVTPRVVEETAAPVSHSTKVAGGRMITAMQLARYNELIRLGYGSEKAGYLPALKRNDGVNPIPAPDGRYFIDDAHARFFEQMSIHFDSGIKP